MAKNKFINKSGALSIVIVLGILFSLYFVNASFGIVAEYAEEGKMLEIAPGQSINTYFKIQNSEIAKDLVVEASIVKGEDIASLVDGKKYKVAGGEQKVVYVKINVPKDAQIGTEYPVEVLFKEAKDESAGSDEGKMMSFVFNVDREFKVRVVEKTAENVKVSSGTRSVSMGVWIALVVIIIIGLGMWWLVRKKKKEE